MSEARQAGISAVVAAYVTDTGEQPSDEDYEHICRLVDLVLESAAPFISVGLPRDEARRRVALTWRRRLRRGEQVP